MAVGGRLEVPKIKVVIMSMIIYVLLEKPADNFNCKVICLCQLTNMLTNDMISYSYSLDLNQSEAMTT